MHRLLFVVGEVHPRSALQCQEDLLERTRGGLQGFCRQPSLGPFNIRMLPYPDQFPRDLLRRQDKIHPAGGHGAVRHARELGRLLVLHHRNAASRLDRPHPERPVGARARQDDPDGRVALVFRQRA